MSWGYRHGKNSLHLFSDRENLMYSKILENGFILTDEYTNLFGESFNAIKFEVNKKLKLRKEPIIIKEFIETDFSGRRIYKYFIK